MACLASMAQHSTFSPRRKKLRTDDELKGSYNVPTSNPYEVLYGEEEMEETDLVKDPSTSTKTKVITFPPIVLYTPITNFNATMNHNIKPILKSEFFVKNKRDRVIFFTTSKEDHNSLKALFRSQGLEFHTYTLKDERKPCLVLKGLPSNISPDEIKNDLNGHLEIENIVQFEKKLPDNSLKKLPIYRITLKNREQLKRLEKVTAVCHCIVQWENYKNKASAVQCYNCQGFHHVSYNCHRKKKCLYCSEEHVSAQCPKKVNNQLKCSNCEGNHASNSPECEVLKKQALRAETQREKSKKKESFRWKKEEFPSMRPGKPVPGFSQRGSSTSNNFGNILGFIMEVKNFFKNINFSTVCAKVMQIIHNFISAEDMISKVGALVEGMCEIFADYV